MVVCAHGDVAEFCEKHEMVILESYDGSLKDYHGDCPVVVTAQKMTATEYDSLKCELFGRGIELVSVDWIDDEGIVRLLRNQIARRGKRGGRQMFGFTKRNGVVVEIPEKIRVARTVIEMRDAGFTLKQIRETEGVYHSDGKKLATSTIQQIIKNRDKYKKV
jgi:hypothetical protein